VILDASFLELHLQPLDDEQMRQFVTNWYSLVEHSALRDPQQATVEADRRTRDLLDTLSQTDFTAVARVYEMTRNPLLLTAICLVHRERGRLPHMRAQLYEESITVLLERWRGRPLPVDQAARVFQPVAHWMHSQVGRTKATLAELRQVVSLGLAPLRHVEVDVDGFLRSIRDDSGLMMDLGMDEYRFMHLGFQEFLTARWLRNVAHKQPHELAALARHFDESWWREVILLILALDDPSVFDELMRAVVGQPEFPRWADSEMMALALREAAEVSAAPFVEVLSASGGVATDWAEQQLAALRLLARAMPVEVDRLAHVLREHPTAAIREWWRKRERYQGRGGNDVIVASRGGVELVRIPGGRFTMGEGSDAHDVELADFYLARTSVTNAQYGTYLKMNPKARTPNRWGDRRYNQPEQPVVGVSWYDAMAYCEWAGLTLPTEAQWEHACRAGTTTRYYSGNREKDLAKVGWYDGNSGGRAHPVAEKEPNDRGLYDMHGNIWEWCLDENGSYDVKPRVKNGLRHPPNGGDHRVLRGGSWDNGAELARSTAREWDTAGGRWVNVGFRPASGTYE
jgi:formylglycine-generating enzyme required for sulfatase activity